MPFLIAMMSLGLTSETGAGNGELRLDTEREHLDGLYANDERVTDDLHNGWFGVAPNQAPSDFWDGATVTIRKLDKIDPDTGRKESGQIRFYAKWGDPQFGTYYGINAYDFQTLQTNDLVTSGVNKRPNEGVYGSSSTIPGNAEFWMEGVRPGKITLEWRFQKWNFDVTYEQTFQVETRQTLTDWRDEIRYQIRLQTKVKTGAEVDIALYHPGNGFRNTVAGTPPEHDNVRRVQEIYYYYRQLFQQYPDEFMWAGMAKTAAAPIYAGMSDLTTWQQAQKIPGVSSDNGLGTEILIEGLLLGGQKAIFTDKAWAHRAYVASGKWALDWVRSENNNATDFIAWDDLDNGILDQDQPTINAANQILLRREQRDVVQQYYFDFATSNRMKQPPLQSWVGAVAVPEDSNGLVNAGEWLSANANKNPMPGGPAFRPSIPGGRIDVYNDRWAWTSNIVHGMVQIWTGTATNAVQFDSAKRMAENNKTMYSAAAAYSFDPGGLPVE